jgi:hypothetical protein
MPTHHRVWNKGRLLSQKPPLKPKEIWSLRIRLQRAAKQRDLAMFNLAIDSKLRGCDLVSLRVRDVYQGTVVASRAIVMQRSKTQRPVQFEITETTRESVSALGCYPRSALRQLPLSRTRRGQPPIRSTVQPHGERMGRLHLDSTKADTAHTHCGGPRLP